MTPDGWTPNLTTRDQRTRTETELLQVEAKLKPSCWSQTWPRLLFSYDPVSKDSNVVDSFSYLPSVGFLNPSRYLSIVPAFLLTTPDSTARLLSPPNWHTHVETAITLCLQTKGRVCVRRKVSLGGGYHRSSEYEGEFHWVGITWVGYNYGVFLLLLELWNCF